MYSPTVSFSSDRNTASSHTTPDLQGPSSPATSADAPSDDSAGIESKRGGLGIARARQQVREKESSAQAEDVSEGSAQAEDIPEGSAQEKTTCEDNTREDDISETVHCVLQTHSELAQDQKPSGRVEHPEGDLVWQITPAEYSQLQRLVDTRDPRYSKAAGWAGDKACQEYDARAGVLRLRMPNPIHDRLAFLVTQEILSTLEQTLQNHSDSNVRALDRGWHLTGSAKVSLDDGSEFLPDEGISREGAVPPPFVVEVNFTSNLPNQKAFRYMNGTGGAVRCVLYLKIENRTPEQRRKDRNPYSLTVSLFQLQQRNGKWKPTMTLDNVHIPHTPDGQDGVAFRLFDFDDELPPTSFTLSHHRIRELLDGIPQKMQESIDGVGARGVKRPRDFSPNLEAEEASHNEVDHNTTPSPKSGDSQGSSYSRPQSKKVRRNLPARDRSRRQAGIPPDESPPALNPDPEEGPSGHAAGEGP